MKTNLNNDYALISPENEIGQFVNANEKTLEILSAMKMELDKHFPDCDLSLEVCDKLTWTSETKLLVNVHVSEEMFFNGVLSRFNEIYDSIDSMIGDVLCPVVLFPMLSNQEYDRFARYGAINMIARAAYFNNDFDENFQREITLRDIPKAQQVKEIIEYCNSN